jgi:DNA repair protein RecO (recombination protein O)
MSYCEVVVYFKGSRSVQTLSESSHVRPFHGLTRSLEGLSYGMRVTELVYALMQEEERSLGVFNLLLEVLDRLNRATSRFENIIHYFQLRLATVLGFAPRFDREELERIPGSGGVLSLETGALRRSDPQDGGSVRRASRKALRAFAIFARADLDAVVRLRLDDRTLAELSRLVEDFLRYHVEEAYPMRGTRILGSLVGRR